MVRKDRDQGWKPAVGDKVTCTSSNHQYPAKILAIGPDPKDPSKNPATKYFVHYNGWNKNWDEWVDLDRLKEFSAGDVDESQKKVKSARVAGSGRKKLGAASLSQASSVDDLMITEPEKPSHIDKEVQIQIPEELKSWLIDDEDNIRNKKLTIIPAKPNISSILKDFVTSRKTTNKSVDEAVLAELTFGIRDYFNVMLGSHLLYKFERLQYQQLLKDHGQDVALELHYGVIHLLRLLTKMGRVLAHSTLEPHDVGKIVMYLHDLLKYICKQSALFDLEKVYFVAPPDYIKNALR